MKIVPFQLDEIKVLKAISHENIVKYVDDFYDYGVFKIVMEWCSGGDLFEAIKRQKKLSKPFAEDNVIIWFGQLASGLQYLHGLNIIHRDMKPSNIFITTFKTLKIGDFGLAKLLDEKDIVAKTDCGTLLYKAPEVFEGRIQDHKVDMWGLGCVAYEMITLNKAFATVTDALASIYNPISQYLHPQVTPFVSKLLVTDPEKRPNAEEILNRLVHCSLTIK